MASAIDFDYRPDTFAHMTAIGGRVRDLRKDRKLTQPQLAKLVGIDQSTISDIERGASIRAEVLIRLAAALGVTAEFIVTGAGAMSWPFPKVPVERYMALDEGDKGHVQREMLRAIAECEQTFAAPPPPPADLPGRTTYNLTNIKTSRTKRGI